MLNYMNSLAVKIKEQIAAGKLADATETWRNLEAVISDHSNNVVCFHVFFLKKT